MLFDNFSDIFLEVPKSVYFGVPRGFGHFTGKLTKGIIINDLLKMVNNPIIGAVLLTLKHDFKKVGKEALCWIY